MGYEDKQREIGLCRMGGSRWADPRSQKRDLGHPSICFKEGE
jgi:hypothetical protein